MIAALLALAIGAADACAAVEPASTPDPAAAARYRQVGDAERAAGSRDTAVVAYRAAAALDPADSASRNALRALCMGGTARGDQFQDGLRRMRSGDLILVGEGDVRSEHLGAPSAVANIGQKTAEQLVGEGFSLDAFERDLVLAAVRRAGGNKTNAARLLGVSRRRLYSLLASFDQDGREE